ncbi:hypothetical protein [Coxiella-like endosymbiont of Rhipicephalus sanguineus]|uniref:hypothetical protein n=1 Tax=Coxiella-like endosymbiont of Rhipicephalus sanguineus TaxID=1955402 RepID=UPI00203E2F82|nr:hypothetical protein [Coxiella-like endosymbiont of Rhipicephalus sanguineus]
MDHREITSQKPCERRETYHLCLLILIGMFILLFRKKAMTFNLSPLIVCDIIVRAREFHAKEGVVIPENVNKLSGEDFMQILSDHQNDLT